MWQALLIKVENNLSNIIATSVEEGTAATPHTSFKGQRWMAGICTGIHVGSRRKGKHWQDPHYKHIWIQRTGIHYLRNGSLMLSFESGTNI